MISFNSRFMQAWLRAPDDVRIVQMYTRECARDGCREKSRLVPLSKEFPSDFSTLIVPLDFRSNNDLSQADIQAYYPRAMSLL